MTVPDPAERPPVIIDPRPRQLLERYASLTGGVVMDLGDGLVRMEIAESERGHWEGAGSVCLAIAPEALDADPEAELLGVGSPMFDRLLNAIRTRGFLDHRGIIPPTVATDQVPLPPVTVEGASADTPAVELRWVPVGRLLARVSIQAGPRLEERLVESPLVDLATGVLLPVDIQPPRESMVAGPDKTRQTVAPRRLAAEFLPLLFEELELGLREDVAKLQAEASSAMQGEVGRLEAYYEAMLQEVEPEEDPEDTKAAKKAIRAERDRRTTEERDRYTVRLVVHPLQLTEWALPTQAATWQLTTPTGRGASFSAIRPLVGSAAWAINCPSCGVVSGTIRVCEEGHASCPSCSERCGVCGVTSCRTHGGATCAVEGHPVCKEHARTCGSCGTHHCSTHARQCDIGDHEVCPSCWHNCGRCGVALCRAHGTETLPSAPLGRRWLCSACATLCEGGANEPIGLDEATRCASCERYVCTHHQAICVVDGQIHCSKHLRRSDHTGRLACAHHRGACADEPKSVLASDEVGLCSTCGRSVCTDHGGPCDADGARHCRSHLRSLADRTGTFACEQHLTICHVDRVAFSIAGTSPCPVCERLTCQRHLAKCKNCHRAVCPTDIAEGHCQTCRRLEVLVDPSDDVVQASLAANGGVPPKPKSWRWARDPSGAVISMELGWARRLVFTLPEGSTAPKTVVMHGLLGSRRMR